MPQQVITAKWTEDELTLMDDLIDKTGAESRSMLLRLALMTLAEDQLVAPAVIKRAQASRTSRPFRPMSEVQRQALVAKRARVPKQPGGLKRP